MSDFIHYALGLSKFHSLAASRDVITYQTMVIGANLTPTGIPNLEQTEEENYSVQYRLLSKMWLV